MKVYVTRDDVLSADCWQNVFKNKIAEKCSCAASDVLYNTNTFKIRGKKEPQNRDYYSVKVGENAVKHYVAQPKSDVFALIGWLAAHPTRGAHFHFTPR